MTEGEEERFIIIVKRACIQLKSLAQLAAPRAFSAILTIFFAICLYGQPSTDSFWASTTSKSWLQRIVFSPYYESKADDQIAVVLLDRDTLNLWETDWPLSTVRFAGIINRLACAGARLAFFDVVIDRQYESPENRAALTSAVRDTSSGPLCDDSAPPAKIPVFFANPFLSGAPVPDGTMKDLMQDKALLVTNVKVNAAIYPLTSQEFANAPEADTDLTPAFGIVRRLCVRTERAAEIPKWCKDMPLEDANPLVLQWFDRLPAHQTTISDRMKCQDHARGLIARLLAESGLSSVAKYRLCPPILTLTGADLTRDHAYITENTHGLDPKTLLAGRVVIIGVALDGLNDKIANPINDEIPAVYYHAVALDNLITFGKNYVISPKPTQFIVLMILYIFMVELLFHLIAAITIKGHERRPAWSLNQQGKRIFLYPTMHKKYAWVAWCVSFVICTSAFGTVGYLLRWPVVILVIQFIFGTFLARLNEVRASPNVRTRRGKPK